MIAPRFDEPVLTFENLSVHKRLWDTSTFDIATLAAYHKLHMPYQLMDVYLRACSLEIELDRSGGFEDISDEIDIIRALLYLEGVSPFVVPFCTSYSVNEYSGINSRDSDSLRDKLPEGLKVGLTTKEGKLEAWGLDLALSVQRASGTAEVTPKQCEVVSKRFGLWKQIEKEYPIINIVRRIMVSAPMIHDTAASILQIWQGIESLFPSVTSEVSFRIALLIAQLCVPVRNGGTMYKEVRAAYGTRSKITHGAASKVMGADWDKAWTILCLCLLAVIEREQLPSEQQLMSELMPG